MRDHGRTQKNCQCLAVISKNLAKKHILLDMVKETKRQDVEESFVVRISSANEGRVQNGILQLAKKDTGLYLGWGTYY